MSGLGPLALIVNPAATRAGPPLRTEVTRRLAGLGLQWALVTSGPGDAAALARRVAGEGAAVVVTLGGDGIAGEVAGALAGGPVAMAPLPGGNANVFARALGWPASAQEALSVLAQALAAGRVREASLGLLRAGGAGGPERVFAVNAGMGLDAATVEWIEARPRAKRRLRQAGFVLGLAVAVGRSRGSPHLHVSADGAPAVAGTTVLLACGTPYAYLGARPLDLVPGAAFDGRVAWIELLRTRPDEVVRLVVRAIRGRELPVGGRALAAGRVARELVVRADGPVPVQADGEPLGRHEELRVSPGPVLRAVDPRPPG